MSTLIKLKRSAVPGRVPTTSQLELGELAINTADGKIYIKQYDSGSNTESIVEFSADPNDLLNLIKTVDGANSGLDADLLDGLDSLQFLRSDTDDTMTGNLTIQGNLTVQGNTTYVNTEEILLSDNVIVLNANFTGPSPSENAGIEVERGDETNAVLQWNEGSGYWEILFGGTTGRILTTGDEGSNNGLDADLLDGQEGSYYLDFNNFFNVPPPELDLTLTGKVTGTAFSNTGVMTLTTELANTGVTPGTYGSSSLVPVITVDEDGRITEANTATVAGVSDTYWTSSNNTFTIETADGGFFFTVINEFSNASITDLTSNTISVNDLTSNTISVSDFSANTIIVENLTSNTIQVTTDLTVNGNIIVDGTVDGRDIAADGIKLDGIEANATSDMTATEILDELKTVDGANSGLDADLLDGQHGDYYLDYNNFTNVPAAEVDISLTGKVTGSAFSNTGVLVIDTELANTGVTPGTYGSASLIPIITVDEDGRITDANTVSVAAVSSTTWYSSNNTFTIETADGGIFDTVISEFTGLTVNGDIVVTGLVDGRDVSIDGAKLDGIEANATSDMTASEILEALKTVDGANSGLDADFLDGYSSDDFFNFANNVVANTVNDTEITIEGNTGLSGSGSFTLNQTLAETITIIHADTSSQANVSFSNTEAIESIDFDDFGHVVSVVKRTSSFLTQETADARYVNVDGDTMTGNLVVQATISQDHAAYITDEATTATIFPTDIWTFPIATYSSAEVIITATQGINRHITKLLIVHNGTTASATEFGTIYTNTSLATYEVGISSGNVYLSATPASGTSTNYKVAATLIII